MMGKVVFSAFTVAVLGLASAPGFGIYLKCLDDFSSAQASEVRACCQINSGLGGKCEETDPAPKASLRAPCCQIDVQPSQGAVAFTVKKEHREGLVQVAASLLGDGAVEGKSAGHRVQETRKFSGTGPSPFFIPLRI